MSAEQDKIRSIAERIAGRLAEGAVSSAGDSRGRAEGGDELVQLRATLGELQRRLAQVESRVGQGEGGGFQQRGRAAAAESPTQSAAGQQAGPQRQQQQRAPQQQFTSSTYVSAAHPSQDRFAIDDAVSELVDFFERDKVCSVEPGGKPCDECGMCSARGF